jgi:uncharacterized repeat protein (TIGR01451 family)
MTEPRLRKASPVAVNGIPQRSVRVRAITFLVTAILAGSGLVLAAEGPAIALGPTETTVSGSPNPSTVGQTVQITAGVDAALPPGPVPPAFVTFFDGTSVLGAALLLPTFGFDCPPVGVCSKSYAQISTSSLSVGSHTITAVFIGDANGNLKSSKSYVQVVNSGGSTVEPTKNANLTLTSAPNPSNAGDAVAFKATVTPSGQTSPTPTGYVHLKDGGFPLGFSQPIDGLGQVTFAIVSLSPGTHSITAVYEGDDVYRGGSESNVVLQVVKPVVDLAVTKDCPSGSLLPGDTVSCSLSVTNSGIPAAEGIVLTDDLPPGMIPVGTPSGGGFTCTTWSSDPEIRCTKSSQPSGTSTVTYTLRVGDDVLPASVLTNRARVGSATVDPNPVNNTASYTSLTASCTIDRSSATTGQAIVGTAASDVICGSAYGDDIFAGGGDDVVFGAAGNDRIYGVDGNDRLVGGLGDDQLAGGNGDDRLVGSDGNDAAAGGAGTDSCAAEALGACED